MQSVDSEDRELWTGELQFYLITPGQMLLQMVPVLGSLSLSGLELETNVHTNCKGLQSQRHLLKGWAALRHYGILLCDNEPSCGPSFAALVWVHIWHWPREVRGQQIRWPVATEQNTEYSLQRSKMVWQDAWNQDREGFVLWIMMFTVYSWLNTWLKISLIIFLKSSFISNTTVFCCVWWMVRLV